MAADAAPPRWVVTIDGRLPSLNELLRGNRWQRVRVMEQWKRWTVYAVKEAGVPHLRRARLTVTRYAPGSRQMDADNLAGAGKSCVDGLTAAGVLDDDDPAHVTVAYLARSCPTGKARVELAIAAWEGDGEW